MRSIFIFFLLFILKGREFEKIILIKNQKFIIMNQKKNIPSKKKEGIKKEGISKINLKSLEEKLSNSYSEKSNLGRGEKENFLYIYPENIKDKYSRNGIEGKKFREESRRILIGYSEKIGFLYMKKRIEEMKEEMKGFKKFYKERYSLNDFSSIIYENLKGKNIEEKKDKIKFLMELSKKYFPLLGEEKKKSIPEKKKSIPKKRNPIKKDNLKGIKEGIKKDEGIILKEGIEGKEGDLKG
jgi:hypothetical protein